MIAPLLLLFIYGSLCSEPAWTTYPANVMYSGEYKAFLTSKSTGLLATVTQTMYRTDVTAANYFVSAPRVILSLMGYKQIAPANGDTFQGFDVRISSITITNFYVIHNIYGSSMAYLNYMYLAVSQTNTDFFLGQYTQTVNQAAVSKSYSYDIAVNTNETYPNYPANTIEMKGFLAGYSLKQSTATAFQLNFTLNSKNASYFTIQVSTNANSVLQKINYYRIGYDRTAVERRNNRDVFRDFYFELINNVNVKTIYNVTWGSLGEFQYRNFMMGTNRISINGVAPIAVEFVLYYYFAKSLSTVDVTTPYVNNPAIAKYLHGDTFYHSIAVCAAPDIYYLPTDRKCYSTCPTLAYFTDTSSNTCISCHFTCRTCSAGYLIDKCLTCDTNYRVFNASTTKCDCPVKTYDDLTNLVCPSCHSSCLSCASSAADGCKTCDSALNRELNDPNSDGIGQCLCKSAFSQNSSNQCQSCSLGCLSCSFSTNIQVCSNCNTTSHLTLSNGACICQTNYQLNNGICSLQKCGDGILTQNEQCDDNNLIDRDGCSSSCTVEPEHVCFQDTTISPYSICYFNGTILMTITDVVKSPYSNQVTLTININANSTINDEFLTNYLTNAPSIVIEDVPTRLLIEAKRILASSNTVITAINYDLATKVLQVTFSYNSSFDITKKKIKFQPSMSSANAPVRYFYNSPEAIISLQNTHNKIDTTYYDISDYQKASSLKYAFLALIVLFWVVSFVMIAIGKGNVGMEMMIVYQIAYASLLSQSKLQISFAGLLEFGKYTAGYNLELIKNQVKCVNFSAINLSCNLFNNLNISFFLMVLIAVIFWCLKLANKLLNDKAEKQFIENKNQQHGQEKQERTLQNIMPHIGFADRLSESHLRSAQSESIRNIEENYYKDQEFIPQMVYNILLDAEFFLCFVTVVIWAMSITFIKQSSIESIVEAVCIPVAYLSLWIFWFIKYFKEDFSFMKAHKQSQHLYEDNEDQHEDHQNHQRQRRPEPKVQKKSKFSASFLKVLIYPLVWLCLLGIGIVLAVTQPVGYVAQSLIIAGSAVFLLLNILTEMHQEKLHMFRSIANCIFLILIQGAYILSQSDSIIGSGFPIAISILVMLSFVLASNSIATFYLFKLEIILARKKKQSKQVEKIQIQIKKLEKLKRNKQIQHSGIFLRVKDYKSSQHSSQSQNQRTVKKDPQFISQYAHSPFKPTEQNHKMTRQQIHQILNQNNNKFSQPYVNMEYRQNYPKKPLPETITYTETKKKKFLSPKNYQDSSSKKFQDYTKTIQFQSSNSKTIVNQ